MTESPNPRNILVFGCNAFALEVVKQVAGRDCRLTLVSGSADCLELVSEGDCQAIEADYSKDEVLRELGIGRDAEVVFAVFDEDAKNVFLTISAKFIDPGLTVIAKSQSQESSHKLRAAGANKVIEPYEISGRKVFDLIKRPLIAETIEKVVFGQRDLSVAELEVQPGTWIDGRTVGELELSVRYNLLLLGVVDRELGDEFIFITGGKDHRLDAQDVLVVIGPAAEIERLRRDIG